MIRQYYPNQWAIYNRPYPYPKAKPLSEALVRLSIALSSGVVRPADIPDGYLVNVDFPNA